MGLFRIIVRLLSPQRLPRSRYRAAPRPAEEKLERPRWDRVPASPRSAVRAEIATPPPAPVAAPEAGTIIRGQCWVIDGDTIVIDKVRLRLAGIDAPELDHPWGQRSKWTLVELCKGQVISAHIRPELSYDRVVAQCFLPDGRDLSAELVKCGMALDWAKFSGGRYRELEPPDARKKLWRAEARQRGRYVPPPAD